MRTIRDETTTISYGEISLRGLAPLILMCLVGCGGGNGGGTVSVQPSANPTLYGNLTIAESNVEIVGLAVAMVENTLSVAQTAANEVVVFSSSSGVVYRECSFDGSATITHVDADTSFSVSAGDTLTIEYDECFVDTVNGEMTGIVEIEISGYQISDSTANLSASVDIADPLRIADRVDATLFADVIAQMAIEFSLDPSENLVVRSAGAEQISVTIDGVKETISDLEVARVTRADFPGAESHEVDMDISFNFRYDTGFFGGTVSCESNALFTFVRGNISTANVLCRGRDMTAARSSGSDQVNIDPEGDGTFVVLGTIDWNRVIDGFLNEPSGLNLDNLLGEIATKTVSMVTKDVFYDSGRDRLLVATSASDSSTPNALVAVSLSQNTQSVLATFASEPSAVALSADGGLIYVGFTGGDEIRKYDATTMQLLSSVNIISDDVASNQYGVLDLAVSPVAPHTIAASFNYVGVAVDDVTVFVDDVQLQGRFRNARGGNSSAGERIFFSEDGSRIHSYYQPPPANTGAQDMVVEATGITEVFSNYRFGSDLVLEDGRIYSAGNEYDAETYVKLGTTGRGVRHIAVDSVKRRFYAESFDSFEVWDLDRRLLVATYQLGLEFDSVRGLEVAGDYLVLVTNNDLRVLDTTSIEPMATGECTVSPGQTLEGDTYTQYACDVIDAIYDPFAERIYATVTSEVPGNGNSIAVINHVTSIVENYIPVPSNPKRLVLSGDGTRLYVVFADVEMLVAIDTTSRAVVDTWQLGIITPRNGYNEIEPRRVLQIEASPLEPDTIVALTAEHSNQLDKEFVAFRNGTRLANEVPISALKANDSNPYPRIVFDDTGGLYALHSDNTVPYFETIMLSTTGLASTGTWFDAVSAIWWPYEVSVNGSDVYFPAGDVVSVANQTVDRRFDYNDVTFSDVNAPSAVFADPDSDDVWFLTNASFMSTGLARFDNQDGSLSGADEIPFQFWGRNSDFSHASVFNVGADKLGLIIDEREGVFVVEKSAIE